MNTIRSASFGCVGRDSPFLYIYIYYQFSFSNRIELRSEDTGEGNGVVSHRGTRFLICMKMRVDDACLTFSCAIDQGFTKSLAMTVLSEIGDKTFFAAAVNLYSLSSFYVGLRSGISASLILRLQFLIWYCNLNAI